MSCLFPGATNTNGGLNYNYDTNRDKCIYLIYISYFFHYDISQKVNPKPFYYRYISKNIYYQLNATIDSFSKVL